MNSDIIVHLPWPPSVNTYYAHTKHGVFLSGHGRKYRESVEESISQQCPNLKLVEPILMEVKLFPPDRRTRDLDNHMKGLLDALEASGLIINDSIIDQLFIYRGTIIRGGTSVVEISEAGPLVSPATIPHKVG